MDEQDFAPYILTMSGLYPAGGNHVIAVCVPYEQDYVRPIGCIWIRFSIHALVERSIEFMDETPWMGRTVFASMSVNDTEVHTGALDRS